MARYDPPCGGGVMEFERELLKADDGEGDGGTIINSERYKRLFAEEP